MKHFNNRWLSAAMCAAAMCLGGQSMQAQEKTGGKVFIEDLSIRTGESRMVGIILDNTCSWEYMWVQFDLPEGLEFEAFNADEVDLEAFSLDRVFGEGNQPVHDGNYMVAMSAIFADQKYWDESAVNYAASTGRTYPCIIELADNLLEITTDNGYIAFNGTVPIALVKLHATEELASDATLTINCGFTGKYKNFYTGETVEGELGGTTTVAHVRRVDLQPEVNCDVNGDGAEDINDVNTVINAVLKK